MSQYTDNRFTKDEANTSWNKVFDLVPAGSRVLDVGCSSGNLGAVLTKEKNCEVIGIDIDAADVELAKKRLAGAHLINIEHESIDKLGKFDCVIFADVIEHLQEPANALQKISKSLNKNGVVV